jgi:uncharacterized protein (TIGR02099 family)
MASFNFTSVLRSRWLWVLGGIAAAIPAVVLAWLYWVMFPNLPQYKDDVERLLSAATGYTVTFDKLSGEWGGARPRFAMDGVRISEGERPLLYFSRMEGSFGWRTLFALEPRFHELFVTAPGLIVRRAPDGIIHFGGFTVDPNSPDAAFSDWLLHQGELRIQGATVAWVDDTRGGQPLIMRNVSLSMQSLFTRHAFQVSMTPPAHVATPLALEGVMYGSSLARPEDWHGKASLRIGALELASWRPWLPAEYARTRGHGSVEAALEVSQGRLSASGFKLNLADIYVESAQLGAPVDLARLYGEVGWQRPQPLKAGAPQTLYARGLSLSDRSGAMADPFDFTFRWGDGGQKLTAAHASLTQLVALSHTLPLEESWKARIRELAPRGRIDSLQASWQGELPAPKAFSVDARFSGLGWSAGEGRPGIVNLSGMLAGNEEKGRYDIAGKQSGFELPDFFAEPQFRFDILNVRGGWKRQKDRHYKFDIAEAVLANADLSATFYGRYQVVGKVPGVADLTGQLTRGQGPRVQRYLPFSVNADTQAWLRNSILRGEVKEGTFRLQGDLAKFPFRTPEEGTFRVAGRLYGGQLRFVPEYPQIDDIEGDLLFDGVRMEIHSDKARIFGAQLHKVKAVIPDLEASEKLLEIDGEAVGPAQEFIRFVNFSPVSEMLDGLTEEMTANGDLHLKMNIKVPLRHVADTTLAGRLAFAGNTVFPGPDMPRLEQVKGDIDFTGESVTAQKITARILGGPATVTAATQDGRIQVRGQGSFAAAALETWFGKGIAERLSGKSDWKGELDLERGKPRFRLESNLLGLDARLPAPLRKTSDRPARFFFEQQSLEGGIKRSVLQYGSVATAVWLSAPTAAGSRLERGELNFGGRAQLPSQPGLRIAGRMNSFDLGGWADILPEGRSGGDTLVSGIDLSLGSLEFLGRQFNDIRIAGGLKGNLLRTAVSGEGMSGNVTYRRPEGENPARVSAQFRQFVLPDPLPYADAAGGASMRLQAADFPALDLQVDDLRFGSRSMGRCEVMAHGVPTGMAIDQLNLTHTDSVIRMNGVWKDTGLGETRMKVNADILDAGKLLERFGYANALRRGTATIEGEVTWLRSPADFSCATLDGTLKLNAKNGQFLQVKPGAGKLLAIASLQSLPKRVALDFRDVFSEGFAFDEISSTMQVADGTVYTSDFLMKGSAASVKMSGMAQIRDETVKLRVKVSPNVSEGVAVAGALLGGPVAGVGALVVQKVLKDPFGEAVSFEYLVEGSWENPTVTKLSKPKPAQEKEPES